MIFRACACYFGKICITLGAISTNCEKNMQKIPIFLSTLALTTAVPLVGLEGLDGMGGLVDVGRGLSGEGLLGEGRRTTELPVDNPYDPLFHIWMIDPVSGTVDVEMNSPAGRRLQVRKIWLATVDYENGWTEAEVDERLDGWTELKADWTRVTKEKELTNMALKSYATLGLTIGTSTLRYNLATVNLLDVIYYAAEFEDLDDESGERVWVRGKADYRGCVHATEFATAEATTCTQALNTEAGTLRYLAKGASGEEEVVTWEEEWRQTLAGRLDEIEAVVERMEGEEEAMEWELDYEEEKLAGVERLLGKATGVDDEVARAEDLRERLAKLRAGEEDNGDEGDSGDGPVGGAGIWVGGGAGSGGSSGAGGVSGGSAEVTEVVGDSGSDAEEGDSAESGEVWEERPSEGGDAVVGSAMTGVAAGQGAGSGGEMLGGEAAIDDDAVTGMTEAKAEAGEEAEVGDEAEIPKLGGAKARREWIWWAAGLSGAMVLFLLLGWKRKQRKDGQE